MSGELRSLAARCVFPSFPGDEPPDWIRRFLAKEMYIYAFNVDESDRIFAQTDPEVQRAIDAMPNPNFSLRM